MLPAIYYTATVRLVFQHLKKRVTEPKHQGFVPNIIKYVLSEENLLKQ